jgi:hypothetical protein
MSGDSHDPPLPLGAQAYLAAFDRYLFAQTHSDKVDARHEMREQLDVMIDHSEADVDLARRPLQWTEERRRRGFPSRRRAA